MPIKPEPFKLKCPCGWSKVCAPSSDVVTVKDGYLSNCPSCGSEHLQHEPTNLIESALKQVERSLVKILYRK